jgi:hypothetical protein
MGGHYENHAEGPASHRVCLRGPAPALLGGTGAGALISCLCSLRRLAHTMQPGRTGGLDHHHALGGTRVCLCGDDRGGGVGVCAGAGLRGRPAGGDADGGTRATPADGHRPCPGGTPASAAPGLGADHYPDESAPCCEGWQSVSCSARRPEGWRADGVRRSTGTVSGDEAGGGATPDRPRPLRAAPSTPRGGAHEGVRHSAARCRAAARCAGSHAMRHDVSSMEDAPHCPTRGA